MRVRTRRRGDGDGLVLRRRRRRAGRRRGRRLLLLLLLLLHHHLRLQRRPLGVCEVGREAAVARLERRHLTVAFRHDGQAHGLHHALPRVANERDLGSPHLLKSLGERPRLRKHPRPRKRLRLHLFKSRQRRGAVVLLGA